MKVKYFSKNQKLNLIVRSLLVVVVSLGKLLFRVVGRLVLKLCTRRRRRWWIISVIIIVRILLVVIVATGWSTGRHTLLDHVWWRWWMRRRTRWRRVWRVTTAPVALAVVVEAVAVAVAVVLTVRRAVVQVGVRVAG